MACDCEKKPAGAPDDSIRNAAAMWMAAGKRAGFVEGVEWAIKALVGAEPALSLIAAKYARADSQRARMSAAIAQLCKQMSDAVEAQRKEVDGLNKMALAMAERLEARTPTPAPSIRRRFRAALTALRG